MSALSAWMFCAVSRRVSPLVVLEEAASNEMTSALSSLAAISKEMRVRVLGSRKRLTTVLPRSAGTFLTLRSRMRRNAPAVARTCSISARVSSSMVRKCLRCQGTGRFLVGGQDHNGIGSGDLVVEGDHDFLRFGGGDRQSAIIGGDRQAAAAAVDQHGQFHSSGAAVVEELIERGLHG